MPYALVAENLKVLNEEALKEVNDFILFLISKNATKTEIVNTADKISQLQGSLSYVADANLRNQEDAAWQSAIQEKFAK